MINLKSILKLASEPHSLPIMRAVVFDGRNAIAVAHSRDLQPWWAGVPSEQDDIVRSGKGPRAVPVDAIKAHQLRSMFLKVAPDHLHNGQGMRTNFADTKTDWSDALTLLPGQPEGVPVQFELELDALDRVLVAASDHDVRGALQGVLLDLTTGRIVGCDGHRLHVYDRKVPKLLPKKGQGALHVLLPKMAAKWLLSSDDAKATVQIWKLGTEQPLVLMRTTDGLIYTKAIIGTFPDYLKVLQPASAYRQWAQLHPAKLADAAVAMEKLHALEKPKLLSVGVQWEEGRVYAGAGPNFVAVERTWGGAQVLKPGTAYGWYFPRYLADLADCVTTGARWCLPEPTSARKTCELPLAVFDEDFSAVLMPQKPLLDGPPSDKVPPARKQAGKGPKPPVGPASGPAPARRPTGAAKAGSQPPQPAPAAPKVPPKAKRPATGPKTGPGGPAGPSGTPAAAPAPAPAAAPAPAPAAQPGAKAARKPKGQPKP